MTGLPLSNWKISQGSPWLCTQIIPAPEGYAMPLSGIFRDIIMTLTAKQHFLLSNISPYFISKPNGFASCGRNCKENITQSGGASPCRQTNRRPELCCGRFPKQKPDILKNQVTIPLSCAMILLNISPQGGYEFSVEKLRFSVELRSIQHEHKKNSHSLCNSGCGTVCY